jgi:NAD-dependent deacetylase
VSTESGIPDFRGVDGLYGIKYAHPPEIILSRGFFNDHTEEFFCFYRDRMLYPDARPNRAHLALAELERRGKVKAVITQNIDGLHTMAGSVNVLELHGNAHRNHCMICNKRYEMGFIMQRGGIPRCACSGIIKPDVVLYEEGLDSGTLDAAIRAILAADALIVGGTSLNVYPAAGLIDYYGGDKLVLINKSETPYDKQADLIIRGSIGEALGEAAG